MTLLEFIQGSPSIIPDDLTATLRVMRTLLPLLPTYWDGTYDQVILNVLSHLVEDTPLADAVIKDCYPPAPTIHMPREVSLAGQPSCLEEGGFVPDLRWNIHPDQPIDRYEAGERVNVYLLIKRPWIPADIRHMAEEAAARDEEACRSLHTILRGDRDAPEWNSGA